MSVFIGKLNHFYHNIRCICTHSWPPCILFRYYNTDPVSINGKTSPDTVYVAAFHQLLFLFPVDVGKNRLIAHAPENSSAYKKYLLYYNLLLNFMSISYY